MTADHAVTGHQKELEESTGAINGRKTTYYYHVTPKTNLSRIVAQGLVPQCGARSALIGDEPAVYVFRSRDALEDALMNWMGELFDDTVPLVALTIDLPEHWPIVIDPSCPWEARCDKEIPPQYFSYCEEI